MDLVRHPLCLLILSSYLRPPAKRMLTASIKNNNKRVAAYQASFDNLKESFLNESALFTEITVFQISLKTDDMLSKLEQICK
jgi:hypothetical protein